MPVRDEIKCRQCSITVLYQMDEMKIKSGLVFNKHTGHLYGFIDLGSANCDIECAVNDQYKQDAMLASVCVPS